MNDLHLTIYRVGGSHEGVGNVCFGIERADRHRCACVISSRQFSAAWFWRFVTAKVNYPATFAKLGSRVF